jgi:monofunctional biosynthetic peptidoglycan transglycosylase
VRRAPARRSRVWRWTAWTIGSLALVVLVVQLWFFGHILSWRHANPASTAFMKARLAVLQGKTPKAKLEHTWATYPTVSVHLKRAILAAEDARFIDHEGFDWEGIQRALDKNQKKGRVVAGGSTITQQLAKNLFLSGERSWLRKGQEALIAAMLEAALDKRRIFEIYLNVVEWGDDVFGAQAAARHYYGVSAAELSPAQAARLAAMLPRPRFYQRNSDSQYLANYAGTILARMPKIKVP